MISTVLWQSPVLSTTERCTLAQSPSGFNLRGSILAVLQGEPAFVTYSVDTDKAWKTKMLRIAVELAQSRRAVRLESDGNGNWHIDDKPDHVLGGCMDVDIEITPATNTLPIRRLDIRVGESATTTAAWVRVPGLTVERLEQTYARLSETSYRYSSSNFVARLDVDETGLVLEYEGLWRTLAKKATGDRLPGLPRL